MLQMNAMQVMLLIMMRSRWLFYGESDTEMSSRSEEKKHRFRSELSCQVLDSLRSSILYIFSDSRRLYLFF